MSEVVVRRAGVSDADALRSIRLESLLDEPDAYGAIYADCAGWTTERWRQMASEWNYYLALDGDHVIGMASGGAYVPRPEARWLYGMYVTASARGTGVAVDLVAAVAEWARAQKVATLGLQVTSTLSRARAFYRKLGFVEDGASEPMQRDPSLVLVTMVTDLASNGRI